MKILIVEDDADLASTLQDLLELEGHHVDVCGHLSEARAALDEDGSYDAAVFDVNLRDGNSIRMLKELRDSRPSLRTIAMTGGGRIDADVGVPLAQINGADAVLFKPFENQEFLDAVLG